MEFRGTDTMVYDMILRIMDEFGLSPDDLEAYQKEERSCVSITELKRRLEMSPDKQMVPNDWRGFRPMA